MSGTFQVAPRAKADLDEIWLYISVDRPQAADRMLTRFQATFELLASQPHLGELHRELRNCRAFPVASYVVYYRVLELDADVEIVRVLHGARDVDQTLVF